MNCTGSTMRARTGARTTCSCFGLADVAFRERLHFAEGEREVERRVGDGAEVGVLRARAPGRSSGTMVKLICLWSAIRLAYQRRLADVAAQ